MATLNGNTLSLIDHAKRIDPDGKVPHIVEMLSQTNEVLEDMQFMEGNLITGHRTTIRTGLPLVYWKLLGRPIPPSKSTTAQVDEGCGKMMAFSECDQDLAELGGNAAQFRLSEASAFIDAMGQEHASTLFYGNSSLSPQEFTGLAPRYSDLGAANADNIVVGGGAGADNTSIWLVCWGDKSAHGVFPKGSKAGLVHNDLGLETKEGSDGSLDRVYRDQFKWDTGMVLKDWRYVVRIPNIDVSNLVAKSSAADLTELMIKAMHRIPNLNAGKCAFYMNRTVLQMLDIQRKDSVAGGGGLTYENIDGKMIPHFRGVPLRKCDAILETEALVS